MKRFILLLICITLCLSLASCGDKIVENDEYSLEESIKKLEEGIEKKYGLDEFDLIRISVPNLKGGKWPQRPRMEIEGYYTQDHSRMYWHKYFVITDNDKTTLLELYDDSHYIVYNEISASNLRDLSSSNHSDPEYAIITDTPAWAIEGIYKIVF